ncbi:MAG TPA: SDR family NAD(P)-dependent oxidoreductase [Acidimicrobiia bacterium]|nr:SDR family NAD(P)-dependent oxidoreductase [Acidimicrobiia bacterium]
MGRLDGRVAIVTGAGGGIGREHALLLGREGAAVVVDDLGSRTGSDAAAVADEIRVAGGAAVATTASATWDGAREIVQVALEEFGGVDILVNNATAGRNDDLWRYSEAEWDLTIDVNLTGYYALMRESIPHMARRGGGAIVNTSSASGFGHPSHGAYAAAKEGLIGLTRTAAMEVGRFGIRCNAIRPFAITLQVHEYNEHSAPWRALMDGTMGRPSEQQPADVIAPAKIAPLVVWLCTEAASGVNGRTFLVFGDRISLLTEPRPKATIEQAGGWTLDDLDRVAPEQLVPRVTNRWTLDGHPELQVFPGDDGGIAPLLTKR